jgi:hypothetical protein
MRKLRGKWISPVFGSGGAFPSQNTKSCSENIPADASPVKRTLVLVVSVNLFHVSPKVRCFEACIEFISECRPRNYGKYTREWAEVTKRVQKVTEEDPM